MGSILPVMTAAAKALHHNTCLTPKCQTRPSPRPLRLARQLIRTFRLLRLWCGTWIPFHPYSRIYLSPSCRYTLTPQVVASRSLDHPDCCIARSAPNMRLQPLRHGWMRRSCTITIGMQLPPILPPCLASWGCCPSKLGVVSS